MSETLMLPTSDAEVPRQRAALAAMTAARLRRARRAVRVRGAAVVLAWTLAFLVLADVGLNVAFRRPAKPTSKPEGMKAYLAYGYSTEGKLRYMVRPTDAASGPLVHVGWVADGAAHPTVIPAPDDQPRVRMSTFGMSFSNGISRAVHGLDPTVQVALYAGPEAPPNHAYALYQAARRLGPAAPQADVVCWGILASAVKGMTTLTGDTWMFEAPAPFCYPRYTLDPSGNLVERWPTIRTEADLRAALADPNKMAAFRTSLSAGDRFYDPLLFGLPWLDHSALARMVRRAYADHHVSALSAQIERPHAGFADEADVGRPLRAMCRQFAADVRADGRRPLIILIQDQGSPSDLYDLLGPALTEAGVPFVSTHEIVRTSDRSNFVADGHFTPAAYDRVAAAVLGRINAVP